MPRSVLVLAPLLLPLPARADAARDTDQQVLGMALSAEPSSSRSDASDRLDQLVVAARQRLPSACEHLGERFRLQSG